MNLTEQDINCIIAFFMLAGYFIIGAAIMGLIWIAIPRRKQRAILNWLEDNFE